MGASAKRRKPASSGKSRSAGTTKRRASVAATGEEDSASDVSTRPFWSGTITFGLVSIPVDLYPANRHGGVSLRMLGPEGKPLRRQYHADKGEKGEKAKNALEGEELVRGYEYEKGKFVTVTDEELERLAPDKTRDIALQRFVPLDELDPLYFERAYFLAPAGQSAKAYHLLAESMGASKRAGIATFVMRGKEYLIAIVSEKGILRAETLRFADELRKPSAIGIDEKPRVSATKVKAFEQIITRSTKRQLQTKLLEDEYAKQLRALAKRKLAKGEDVVEVEMEDEVTGEEKVVDLMSVLQRSLRGAKEGRGSSGAGRGSRKKKRAA